jgi:S1-C subfamily serine protease
VVVDADGDVLTAAHVVAHATSIQVTFADGTASGARVVSSEPANDIAVLSAQQPPSVIVPAVLGSSGGLRVGDAAFAAGNPLGLAGSLTAGVISGLDRAVALGGGAGSLQGLIQFDAAVNPGSSGGPLLNRNGQVVGIVTGLVNAAGQDAFAGIGFAVPIATAGGAAGAPAR